MAPFSGQTQGGSAPDEPQRRIPELEEALRRAEDSSRNKSAFIANLSHEIRTPLNSIIGVANLFQGTRLDLEQKKFVEMLSTSARDLHRLVEELLDLSLIETGRLTLQSEPFPVRSNCSRTIRPLAVSIQERRLSLELQVDPAVPEYLRGDSARMSQILRNMVTNAIAFTPKGTIRVRVFLEEETESSANLHVTAGHPDGGTGAEKRRDTDYSDMERKDFSASFQGAGMGLLIARGIAEAMGGKLWTEFSGSGDRIIHFRASLGKVHPEEELPGKETESGEGLPSEKKPLPAEISILVVDDNRFNRSLTRTILRKMGGPGWRVSLAESGSEALQLMEEQHFDLVFMDVQMPEMDGLECTRLVRKKETGRDRRSVIIAMTAYAMEGDRRMCLDAGMDDYIAKPVEAEELRTVISRNLA
jgi:CheY-like chemotaxis protein